MTAFTDGYFIAEDLLRQNPEDQETTLRQLNDHELEGAFLAGFATKFLEQSNRPILSHEAMDTCGTGGDGGSHNFSTGAALIAAACNIPVIKHGNNNITSRSGSTNFLYQLGINTEAPPENVFEETNFCYLHAPNYHPALASLAPIRRRIGRTIFNILGPLLNPTQPTHQLVGVSNEDLLEPMAHALRELGRRKALIVHSQGLDELSTAGLNSYALLEEGDIMYGQIPPTSVGLQQTTLEELAGGDPAYNAATFIQLAQGELTGPVADTYLLNAGAAVALWTGKNIPEGIQAARETIPSGELLKKVQDIRTSSNRYRPDTE